MAGPIDVSGGCRPHKMAAMRLMLALCLGHAGGEEAYPTATASATQTDSSSAEVSTLLRRGRVGVGGVRD